MVEPIAADVKIKLIKLPIDRASTSADSTCSPTCIAVEQSVSGRACAPRVIKCCLDSANQFRVRERLGDAYKLFHPRIKSVAESGHK